MKNEKLESSILAATIIEKDYLDFVKRAGVQPEYFSDGFHSQIYSTMLELNKQGIVPDLIALIEKFPDRENDLMSMCETIGSGADIESWVKLLKGRFAKRILATASKTITSNPENIQKNIPLLETALEQAKQLTSDRKETTLKSALKSYCEAHAKGSAERVYWFDPHTEGRLKMIQYRGEMFIVAADSGKGKTEIASNFVYQNLREDKKGMYVCTESGSGQILARIASQFAKVSHKTANLDYPPKAQLDKFLDAMKSLANDYEDRLKIYGSESGVNSADAIYAAAKAFVAQHGKLDFIVVDYIQNLQTPSHIPATDQFSSLSYSVQKIHETLTACNAAGVVLSQLNRPPKTGGNPLPDMNRLRGSSSLENEPHAICMLWRDSAGQSKFYSVKVRNIDPFKLDLTWSGWTYKSNILYDPNELT